MISRSTLIPLKKYKTFGDIQDAPIISAIQCITRMKESPDKDMLTEWLFDTHYLNKPIRGNLTDRIKNFDNKICLNYICKNFLNGFDPGECEETQILSDTACNIIKKLHSIQSSLTGTFIDYLMRRVISEIKKEDFIDNRANKILYDNEVIYDDPLIHTCLNGCKYNIKVKNPWQEKECELDYCQFDCYYKTKNTEQYKTKDIIVEIFMVSLCHIECFSGCPDQEKLENIIHELKSDAFIKDFYEPFYSYCNRLIKNKKKIYLNPTLGCRENMIPADCDIIIDDTLFDIKCTLGNKTTTELLQLLGYTSLVYSNPSIKSTIKKISIINLYKGYEYIYDISEIPEESILFLLALLQGNVKIEQ